MVVLVGRQRGDDQADLDKYKGDLASLTDPRKTTEDAGAAADQDGEADLLAHERRALDRDAAAPRC